MTGITPGALVIASKCTIPIRPHPMTPTLTVFTSSFSSTLMDKVVLGRKAVLFWKEKAMPFWQRALIASKAETIFMVGYFRRFDVIKKMSQKGSGGTGGRNEERRRGRLLNSTRMSLEQRPIDYNYVIIALE
jgi:hypothetical protein